MAQDKKPKVLATFIEAGMGHITSMTAVSEAFKEKYGDNYEIVEDYILQHGQASDKWEQFMIKQVQTCNKLRGFGSFVFFWMEALGQQVLFRIFNKTFEYKATKQCLAAIAAHKPDVILSTNHYTTYCAVQYKKEFDPSVTVVTYNPDNDVHVWWDSRDGTFIVNNEVAAKQAVRQRYFKKKNIRQVPFVTRKALVDCKLTKQTAREKYGIDDNFTVIIADGAYAMAQSIRYTKKLVNIDRPINLLFIASKNKDAENQMLELKASLEAAGNKYVNMKVYPFMPDIHELYLASDIFITKSGPNSIFDCVYMGTPFIVNYCAQPMEHKAYRLWVKRYKCGLKVFEPNRICKVISGFIDNPETLTPYLNNISKYCRAETGANKVADIINEEYLKSKVV